MSDIDLFDNWFRIADRDRDGVVSGAEAVEFFQRSNLGQETLFQVWNMVAGDTPALSKPQFYSTLRLISLAQKSGGQLNEAQARSLLIGVGPAVPPPQLNGLESRATASIQPSWTHDPFARGASAQQPGPGASFPPMQQADMQRYRGMFQQMDNDRDSYVQGGDCFGAFMQWGLPKGILKDIWAVVAGDEGRLTADQFVQCLYLMDNAKRGMIPPTRLPPGPFPPMASTLLQQALQGGTTAASPPHASMQHGQQQQGGSFDVFSQDIAFPNLPAQAVHVAPRAPTLPESRAPELDAAQLQGLAASKRSRLTTERDAVLQTEQQLHQTTAQTQAAKRKEAFYQQALQDLTLFKSKTTAAVLQAQERIDKAVSDADAMESQYESAYASARQTYSRGRALLDEIQRARARKVEAETKLAGLQQDIGQLSTMSDTEVAMEEAQAEQLQQAIAQAEAQKAAMEMRAAAVREEQEELQKELETLQLTVEAAKADVGNAQRDLRSLRDKLRAEDRGSVTDLQTLLKNTAEVYRNLVQHANAAGIPVPEEAQMGGGMRGPGQLDYDEFAAANATDWEDFQDEGYKVVSALPNDSRQVSPASSFTSMNQLPSPLGSRGNSFTGPQSKPSPAGQAQSTQSGKSGGGTLADLRDTASSTPSGLNKTSNTGGFDAFGSNTFGESKPGKQPSTANWSAF